MAEGLPPTLADELEALRLRVAEQDPLLPDLNRRISKMFAGLAVHEREQIAGRIRAARLRDPGDDEPPDAPI